MTFLVYDIEQNDIIATYNDRQDADRVCEAFNTVNEVNRRNSNVPPLTSRRYIVISNGNTTPNLTIGLPPTITMSTSALTGSGNNWYNYIGNNAPAPY
jgi:hypothetical protein